MKIAVIGGGPSGLVAAKYCLANNFECDVFEQRGYLGGTWNTDKSGEQKDDNIIYTNLYKGVQTNIPKEIMMYPDHSYPLEEIKSFLGPTEVFQYFKTYADKFNIHQCMKYFTIVENVTPNKNNTWNVTFRHLKTKTTDVAVYDGVFVCNGHLWYPDVPKIPGQNIFKGTQIHSKDYYVPDSYENKKVVVVGARSSARDIVHFISTVANHVYVSYRQYSFVKFTKNVSPKPPILKMYEKSVVFEDGSEEEVDDIVYCTGYDYSYPFLNSECGITVHDRCIFPLYQHIVNVNYPTMFFIGIPSVVCAIPLFDLQTRFAMAILNDQSRLPSKEDMLKEFENKMIEKSKLNIPKRHFHKMGEFQEDYWKELAEVGSIKPLPPVLCRLYEEVRKERRLELHYRIIDNECFETYSNDMKIAVIGGGPTGLVAARHCLAKNFQCDVFEQRGYLGGTWNLDKSDEDENDNITYTYLYKGILTNVPKELMMYPDHCYPPEVTKSFLGPTEVFNYYKSYADKYEIHQCMRVYFTLVEDVTPNMDHSWNVTFRNLKTKITKSAVYDGIFICNGTLWYPNVPEISGQNVFKGRQLHSKNYYAPDSYKHKNVVVVGACTSARDIVHFISTVANYVHVSFREHCLVKFTSNVSPKPPIREIHEHSILFEDGSVEKVDDIIYCTGYNYSFPFLNTECGIIVSRGFVYPLHQHIVNVNYPTMFFIGVPSQVIVPVYDLQAKYAIAVLNDRTILLSKEEMLQELKEKVKGKAKLNIPKHHFHKMGRFQEEYCKELAEVGSIKPLPTVLYRIYEETLRVRRLDLYYRILDDDHFEVYSNMKIAVIGGGPSGLVVAKYCLQNNFDCNVFEQRGYLGGTWNPEKTGHDKNDKLIYATTYEGLRESCFVNFTSNTTPKPPIKVIHEYSVTYEDGTKSDVDDIIYCTGYDYSFPFLSSECEVTVDNNFTYPLYQHIVNVHHPTMFFIGYDYSFPFLSSECEVTVDNNFTYPLYQHIVNVHHPTMFFIGYDYSFPFLSSECEVTVDNNFTYPLYQHIVNVHHPTMFFIGYDYSFPFLSSECEVTVDNNFTYPLYQHIVNVHHPTMFFIGYDYSFPFLSSECEVTVDNNFTYPLYQHIVNVHHPTMFFIGYDYSFPFLSSECEVTVDNNFTYPLYQHIVNVHHPTMFFIGYDYSFPFLSSECEVTVDNNFTYPLYQHIVNVHHPTMFFIGYDYSFPFLSSECEVTVDNNFTYPLYQHIVNVHHPTMFFIGYDYSFPFLSSECEVTVDNNFTYPLYQHIVNVHHPTMFFIGYDYSFPFLSSECEVTVDNNFTYPLYQHIVNVHHPTMFFIGYDYSFPFLSSECEVTVDNNFTYPLYQHIVNVHHPTMFFIGYDYSFPFLSSECEVTVDNNFTYPLYQHIVNVHHPTMFFIGYDYSFPFLSSECEVTVDNNFTYPLYQHIVNVHHPTMFFIGIPWLVCAIPLFDLQTRFSMAVIKNNSILPSKEDMLKDIEEKLHKQKKLNIPKRHFHRIGKDQEVYWKDLARIASIIPLPPVLCRIYEKARIDRRLELHYRIIDDENFEIFIEK
ncbi:hypothetical protein FQA39_LY08245 [Lamprigera yunnana]|nr:hypothetical protein FQA39_LY08245 [Lamprigera yunnana]